MDTAGKFDVDDDSLRSVVRTVKLYVCNVPTIFEGNLTENPRDRVRVVRSLGVKSSQIVHLSIYQFNSWLLVLFPVKM